MLQHANRRKRERISFYSFVKISLIEVDFESVIVEGNDTN